MKHRLARAIAGFIATFAVVLGGTACSGGGTSVGYYDTLCVNPLTQIRMPDYYCAVGNPYYHASWIYYVPFGYVAPAYNVRVNNYTVNNYHMPANASIHTGGVPASGGAAPKLTSGNVSTNKSGTVKSNTASTNKGGSASTNRGSSGGGSNNSTKRGGSSGGGSRGGRH